MSISSANGTTTTTSQKPSFCLNEFQVQLCKNQANAFPRTFLVNPEWDLAKFKKKAGSVLDMKVKRVFLANGSEILSSVDEIALNAVIHVSSGEPFYLNANAQEGIPFRIAVLGTGGVGKSALTLRFTRNTFMEKWESTIEDSYVHTLSMNGHTFRLDILDTAGQDDFVSLRPSWMADRDAYIFVFSLAQPESSFQELEAFAKLHREINLHTQARIQIIVVGNKSDSKHADANHFISLAKKLALDLRGTYVETSAKSGHNVKEVFETLLMEKARMMDLQREVQDKSSCVIM